MDIILVGAAMDIYQSLMKNLDTEGGYYLVNAICNQLRYLNNHTLYFSSVLLSLWAEASSATQQLQSKNTSGQQITHSPMDIILVGAAMDIYQSLMKNLDTEGRYYLVNAICNQLRYPNNHTLYFSFVLLSLWAEASSF
ncbi:uncharacterized protein LOC144548125 [Carex rostrata]